MNDKPMLFNGDMVRALLDGRKTQTRRPCKAYDVSGKSFYDYSHDAMAAMIRNGSPWGQIGDLIWVRETVADCGQRLAYRADKDDGAHCAIKKWTPSIHMPRWASRLTLKITDLRVERVQEITNADAMNEGMPHAAPHRHGPEGIIVADESNNIIEADQYAHKHNTGYNDCWICIFKMMWNSIYSNWNDNPWVWVIDFEVVSKNVDEPIVEAA